MHRWMNCPGSVNLIKKLPSSDRRRPSRHAEEGSEAHSFAAYCLQHNKRPISLLGETLGLDDRVFDVTEEMVEAVTLYQNTIYEGLNRGAGGQLLIEHQFQLDTIHPAAFGTADAVTWRPNEHLLIVDDFKYGAGVPVDVQDNPQLKYYALGAFTTLSFRAKTIRLRITQPRCPHPAGAVRHWDLDTPSLVDFASDLVDYITATEQPDAKLVAGSWCRWCPAAAICPETHAKAQAIAKVDFKPVDGLNYDPEKLKLALDSAPFLEGLAKSIREFAYAEAEAGRCPPGYKIVAKRPVRRWIDEGQVIQHLKKAGVADDEIFEPRAIKSPAQLEKTQGKKTLDDFIMKASSGHALVPESDSRPAVRATPQDDFLAIPDFMKRTDNDV